MSLTPPTVPSSRLRAVIFDCDGVLVDSESMSFDLLAEDLAAHGLPMKRAQMETLFIGGTIAGVADQARRLGAGLPDDWVDRFYDRIITRLAAGTPLIPGIESVLDALDAHAIPYAVGSNGPVRKMKATLGQHQALWARLSGRIFSREHVAHPKPAPDLYLHAAAALGVDPADCVVIEDSPSGARAAHAAGIRCFGYAPQGNEALAAEGASLFTNMADLPALLGL